MHRYIFLVFCCLLANQLIAQLSSRDIRHASGKGPYPIYVNVLGSSLNAASSFGNLIDDYMATKGQSYYPSLKERSHLWGIEGNLGVIINTNHFMGITNFRINRLSLEFGYRYLHRDLHDDTGFQPLHMREDVASYRIGIRGNILYPLTYQLQAGPVLYHRTEVMDSLVHVVQLQTGAFPAGWDFRGRLMLFDPAGTAGGLGGFLEIRYLLTTRGRDFSEVYEVVLGDKSSKAVHERWNYVSWSVGIVVPLALRWL